MRRSRYHGMAPETMDGIMFGLRLAAVPGMTERRDAYWALRTARTKFLATLGQERLAEAAKASGLITLPGYAERATVEDLADRLAACMFGNRVDTYLAALGLTADQIPQPPATAAKDTVAP